MTATDQMISVIPNLDREYPIREASFPVESVRFYRQARTSGDMDYVEIYADQKLAYLSAESPEEFEKRLKAIKEGAA